MKFIFKETYSLWELSWYGLAMSFLTNGQRDGIEFWAIFIAATLFCLIPAIVGQGLYKYFTGEKDSSDFNR